MGVGFLRFLHLLAMAFWLGAGAALMFATDQPWFRPFPEHWLFQMQVFGLLAFLVTVLYVVPGAGALARLALRAAEEDTAPPEFARRVRGQAIVGSSWSAVSWSTWSCSVLFASSLAAVFGGGSEEPWRSG